MYIALHCSYIFAAAALQLQFTLQLNHKLTLHTHFQPLLNQIPQKAGHFEPASQAATPISSTSAHRSLLSGGFRSDRYLAASRADISPPSRHWGRRPASPSGRRGTPQSTGRWPADPPAADRPRTPAERSAGRRERTGRPAHPRTCAHQRNMRTHGNEASGLGGRPSVKQATVKSAFRESPGKKGGYSQHSDLGSHLFN